MYYISDDGLNLAVFFVRVVHFSKSSGIVFFQSRVYLKTAWKHVFWMGNKSRNFRCQNSGSYLSGVTVIEAKLDGMVETGTP